MRNIIFVKELSHLKALIKKEIKANGNLCDLNHIDVSKITDMKNLFMGSYFNGNISEWDTSSVKNMAGMFYNSEFNKDISKWDVSKVEDMQAMFKESKFNQDISVWNVSNVNCISQMFSESEFSKDLSNWKPYKVADIDDAFLKSKAPIPYWAKFEDQDARINAINNYHLSIALNEELNNNIVSKKQIKI